MTYVSPHQDPFRAIADPSRRVILDALMHGEQSVKQLTNLLDMSQPSVSQHLQVLKLSGLVSGKQIGRNVMYAVNARELQPVVDWLSKFEAFWTSKLDVLDAHLLKGKRG
jgi:DNA-binding transcriptional ArsR family regulator